MIWIKHPQNKRLDTWFTRRGLVWCGLLCLVALLHCEAPNPPAERPIASEAPQETTAPSEPTTTDNPSPPEPLCCDAARESSPGRETQAEPAPEEPSLERRDEPLQPETMPEPTPQSLFAMGLTYHRSDGNRWVSGVGNVAADRRLDISLTGAASWLVALPWRGGAVFAVALTDGRIEAFHVVGQTSQKLQLNANSLPPGAPPALALARKDGALRLLTPPTSQASTTNHPVLLSDGRQAFVEQGGDLVLWRDGRELGRLAIKALPDARLLTDERDRILLLTDPTTRYAHGVLGDAVEAASISLFSTTPQLRLLQKITIPGQRVVEGLMPIWADIDGDGSREIIVTLSDASNGAQLVVYDEKGQQVAAGPAIGSGNRWRNQVAVAPFAPDGKRELVDVYTPHIGGPTEFFQRQGNALVRVAQATGYTAHVYGSRNLDLGLAGDFTGAGRPALLLPTQDRTSLGMIQRDASGARVIMSLPLNGQLQSNIAAAHTDKGIIVGAATSGQLHVWGH